MVKGVWIVRAFSKTPYLCDLSTHVAVSCPKRVREKGKNRVILTIMFEEFRSIVRDFSGSEDTKCRPNLCLWHFSVSVNRKVTPLVTKLRLRVNKGKNKVIFCVIMSLLKSLNADK